MYRYDIELKKQKKKNGIFFFFFSFFGNTIYALITRRINRRRSDFDWKSFIFSCAFDFIPGKLVQKLGNFVDRSTEM